MNASDGQLVKLASGSWAVYRRLQSTSPLHQTVLVAMELDESLQERLDDPTSTETELPADAIVS